MNLTQRIASWNPDDVLSSNGLDGNTPLLILGIILMVASIIILGMFVYYLYQFKQRKAKVKIKNPIMIYIVIAILAVVLILGIIGVVLFTQSHAIFYDQLKPDTNYGADTAVIALIVVYVFGYIGLFGVMVFIWFGLNKFAISFTDDEIMFLGEKIEYAKITKIVQDNTKNAVYINFAQGKRSYRRQKFSLNSSIGAWVVKHADLSGHPVEIGDEDEYFKTLIRAK
ncbi:hypothetical protein [Williamsoniiplasma lucivorax]|uniref:Uncharacterized protein n=1 Tax=Williamsoniiplasma lucivorax TaxID=209274 RepID=A0A2S5RDB3_9MOLU|nr:hypothetical protein [Williamsoniiplasma lucivorax]PPE05288.1 hypothetical protein ELUCI_v1c08240 [Williamsoniiplasma lucivorax]